MQTTVKPELGTCAQLIALAQQLFLNGYADACAESILAILSAIAQAQFKYAYDKEYLFSNNCD